MAGVLVLGAGGQGKAMLGVLRASGQQVLGFLDDAPGLQGTHVCGVPVLGPLAAVLRYPDAGAVIALGENAARRDVARRFAQVRWCQAVYPGAYVDCTARLGAGSVVLPGAFIGPEAVLGDHVIVSANVTVGHDVHVEDFAHLAPGVQVAGGARIGAGAMLGLGSAVCPGVRVGAGATLGAGAVAVRDVPPACRAFGMPARALPHPEPLPAAEGTVAAAAPT